MQGMLGIHGSFSSTSVFLKLPQAVIRAKNQVAEYFCCLYEKNQRNSVYMCLYTYQCIYGTYTYAAGCQMATLCSSCLSILSQNLKTKITYTSQLFFPPNLSLITHWGKQHLQRNVSIFVSLEINHGKWKWVNLTWEVIPEKSFCGSCGAENRIWGLMHVRQGLYLHSQSTYFLS